MKRLALGSILVSVAAYAACSSPDPTPPDSSNGGTGTVTGGTAGDTSGASGTGVGGTTGGTTGGTDAIGGTGATPTGGTGGAGPTGGTGGDGVTGGAGGVPTGGTGGDGTGGMGLGGMGLGGMGLGGMGLGGMGLGGMGLGGMPMGGRGGTAGTGGSGGGCPECGLVGMPLTGQTILMPCGQNTETRVCIPMADSTRPCTDPGGSAASYAGTHSHNQQITLGGTPGTMYKITVKIRGMVEAKTYSGGADRASSGTQVPADGLYTGGVANNSGNGYNIYFIRTDSPRQHYYLNSVGVGNDTRIRHSVFDADYSFDMVAEGGSTVCLVSADPNTSAIKNCTEPDVGNVCNPMSLQNLDPAILADIGAQPYNGQFVGVSVTNVVRN